MAQLAAEATLKGVRWLQRRASGADLVSADGREIIEVKVRTPSRRDLISSATQLAMECQRSSAVENAYLVLWNPGLNQTTISEIWNDLGSLFTTDVAARLRLVCVWPDHELLIPDDGSMRQFARAIQLAAESGGGPVPKANRGYEVLKILTRRYFLNEGPIRIKQLQSETGLSHPTVKRDLDRLGKYIERSSNRSVRLKSFPADQWRQLRALGPKIRNTAYYADATGQPVDLPWLAKRVRGLKQEHIAFGGVIAAKEWQADFDLDGTPRIDLCVHAPDGRRDLSFMRDIDPALETTDDETRAAVAVHSLVRRESHFRHHPELSRIADPVETLLDLYELRLDSQADAFLKHWKHHP